MPNIYRSEKYLAELRRIAAELPESGGHVLITGATGLIGSCLTDVLSEAAGWKITVLGRNEEKLRQRFLGRQARLHFLAQDIRQPIVGDYDFIIHAASNADPRSYALYPAETLLTNVIGTDNVLQNAYNHAGTRVLFLSTFEVYGQSTAPVLREADYGLSDFNQVRACYPESKRTAEVLARCYGQEYGVDFVIARLSSIYGPTMLQGDSKAHAQFIRKALAGENIVLKSRGEQRRTYTCVFDAVRGLMKVLLSGESGQAYNVVNGSAVTSIAELANTLASLAGTKVVFDLPDEIEGRGFSRPMDAVLSDEKLRALGYSARYSVEDGMRLTLDILRETLEGEVAR